jgi:hypothetical protein
MHAEDAVAHATQDFVEADLNYLAYDGRRPVNYAYPPPPGIPQSNATFVPHQIRIENGRDQTERPSLHRQGFELRQHASAVQDFSDEAVIRDAYYAEVEQLLKHATGAEKVVIFDHTLRLDTPGHGTVGIREPVRRVHNDQTFVSAPRRVRDHLPAEEAELRLKHRFAIVNVWRPIGAPVATAPLAVCDARSISREDLVPSDLVYRDKVGETYAFRHNPNHRWFYFPEVRPDEVVLLKIYDSLVTGAARLTAHTAFDHPNTLPSAVPRRSIEVRTLVFWPTTR